MQTSLMRSPFIASSTAFASLISSEEQGLIRRRSTEPAELPMKDPPSSGVTVSHQIATIAGLLRFSRARKRLPYSVASYPLVDFEAEEPSRK